MAALDALGPLENLGCPDRMEEKDPGDPWALRVRKEQRERRETPGLVNEESQVLLDP